VVLTAPPRQRDRSTAGFGVHLRKVGSMKPFCLVLVLFVVSPAVFVQTSIRPSAMDVDCFLHQAHPNNEIGIAQYPRVRDLPEATQRLWDAKASTWLLARVYQTDDAIKDVANYFKEQAKANKTAKVNALVKSLLRDNWKVSKGLVRYASNVFGVGSELRTSPSAEKVETTFGVIVLDDSIVRVHLISPYPSSPNNNKLVSGTMIMLIRERLTQQAAANNESDAEGEKVYTGREVTRRARVKSKPEPEYPTSGIGGTVVLRAVFSASGKVTNIRVVSGLPGGFTEAAVKAARKISFEPAIKDGRYVSQWIQLEYNFNP
jgi:TonB family protein